jgi:hypothetical protein
MNSHNRNHRDSSQSGSMPPPTQRRDQTTPGPSRQQRDPQMDNSANKTTSKRRQVVPEDSDEDLPDPASFMQKARMLSQKRGAARSDRGDSSELEQGNDDLVADGPQPGFKEISVTVSDPSKCIMFSWLLILSRYQHLPTQSRHR